MTYQKRDAHYIETLVTEYHYRIGVSLGVLGYYKWGENCSCKGETVIRFAKEYSAHLQQYSIHSKISAARYSRYGNEIKCIRKDELKETVELSRYITDKENMNRMLDEILPTSDRPVKLFLYKLSLKVFTRIKQISALFRV